MMRLGRNCLGNNLKEQKKGYRSSSTLQSHRCLSSACEVRRAGSFVVMLIPHPRASASETTAHPAFQMPPNAIAIDAAQIGHLNHNTFDKQILYLQVPVMPAYNCQAS